MLASCVVMLLVSPIIGFDTCARRYAGYQRCGNGNFADGKRRQQKKDWQTAAALCAVIYSVQKFVGAPIASAMGIRYGKKLLKAIPRESGAV